MQWLRATCRKTYSGKFRLMPTGFSLQVFTLNWLATHILYRRCYFIICHIKMLSGFRMNWNNIVSTNVVQVMGWRLRRRRRQRWWWCDGDGLFESLHMVGVVFLWWYWNSSYGAQGQNETFGSNNQPQNTTLFIPAKTVGGNGPRGCWKVQEYWFMNVKTTVSSTFQNCNLTSVKVCHYA